MTRSVLDTIVAKATQISATEAGAIYVLDEEQREFQLRATFGMSEELIAAVRNMHSEISDAVGMLTETHEPSQQPDLRDVAPTPVNDVVLRAGEFPVSIQTISKKRAAARVGREAPRLAFTQLSSGRQTFVTPTRASRLNQVEIGFSILE